jgi:hypothetical protein
MFLRHSSLFSQLLGTFNRQIFERSVREVEAEKAAKGFKSGSGVSSRIALSPSSDEVPDLIQKFRLARMHSRRHGLVDATQTR